MTKAERALLEEIATTLIWAGYRRMELSRAIAALHDEAKACKNVGTALDKAISEEIKNKPKDIMK